VTNPGAEDGPGAHDSSEVVVPPGWTFLKPEYRMTAVYYGSPGFPTIEQGVALGGGHSFFAGGPAQPEGAEDQPTAIADQEIPLPAEVIADIDAGTVQATGGGCFGGYGTQNDSVVFGAYFEDSAGHTVGSDPVFIAGPGAKERGGQTKLLPYSDTRKVPAGTRFVQVRLLLIRESSAGRFDYNDAYADNLLLQLSASGSTPPPPSCSAPKAPGPSGPTGPGAPGGPAGPNVTPFAIARGSSRATLRSGRVGVSLRCDSGTSPCSGTLRLTVPSLSASVSSVTLGSKAFSIPAGRTATVKVALARRARARVKRMSARQLRRLKVTAKVTVGTASKQFALRLRP
jgi:hypothetical protein